MDRLSAFQGGVSIFSSFIKSFQPLSAFSFCYIKENSICIHGYFLFAGYNKYKEKWQKGAVENVVIFLIAYFTKEEKDHLDSPPDLS